MKIRDVTLELIVKIPSVSTTTLSFNLPLFWDNIYTYIYVLLDSAEVGRFRDERTWWNMAEG